MKVKLIILVIMLIVCSTVNGQTMIGLTKTEVQQRVKKEQKEFRKDNSIVKQRFNYLKYVNVMRTKTWILYFTDTDICKTSKLVCDYSDYDQVVGDLSENYEKIGESHWQYSEKVDTFQVMLTKQEWYFTVRETRKE